MISLSRRRFLQQASTATAGSAAMALLPPSLVPALAAASPETLQTLTDGWEFLRMPLAGPWEVWIDPPLAPWAKVSLPHCFNGYDGCDPDVPAYRGEGWYRRRLELANPFRGGRTLLHFEGAGQSSKIYIGGTLVARHTGGYDEFVVDITDIAARADAVNERGMQLSVLCDNSPDLERMPSDLSDFTLYGGLYRNVHRVYLPAVSIERVHVTVNATAAKPALVKIEARLYNASHIGGSVQLGVTVTDPAGIEVHRFTRQQPIWEETLELTSFSVPQPKLWSPKTPHLYQCRVSIVTSTGASEQLERFGIRFFEFADHGPFLLNGERLLLQGTHRHEDHAGYAAAMPATLIRQEMLLIKEMGANFIRLAHYQQQRLVLDLCDELGLLVWEEIPWCRAGVGDQAFRQQGREKLRTMIDQHFNHASIILWGLGNEDDSEGEYPALDPQAIRDYMQELNTLAHQLDSTRLTSYRRCDFASDVPDVYSPSIWAGWYAGRFVDYEASLLEWHKTTSRLLHVEWGADAHAGRHAEDPYATLAAVREGDTAERGLAYLQHGGSARASRDGDWSETYACDLYDWHLKVQQSLPWLTGAVHWIFKDFTTPLRVDNPVPRVNQKGVVERDMTKKEGYFVFQSYWAEKPMAHIYGHSWPVRWGSADELRTVKVYSNCAAAELFVNGISAGTRKRDIQNFPAAGLRWNVPFRAGANQLRVVATSAAGTPVVDELSFTYQTEAWGAPAKLSLEVIDRSVDKVTVEAKLLDAKGVLCVDARNVVRFTLAGEASLIDNQGTSGGSRAVQLYNGRARITIRMATRTGDRGATAGVSAEDFLPALCSI